MDLNSLSSGPVARKNRKRVGRGPGSGNGKTAGRGHKGQQSRSGYTRRMGFEGGQMPLQRRLPKRGFHHDHRWPRAVVNVDVLNKAFENGDEVTTAILQERNLAATMKGGVKILGRGDLTKKLVIKVEAVSPGAQTKIEAVGGSVVIVAFPEPSQDAAE